MKRSIKILIIFSLILGVVVISGCESIFGPAAVVDTECNCELKPREIAFELGSTEAKGKGILGSTVNVPLTNKADIGAIFQVTADCKTLKKAQTLRSKPMYIPAGAAYNFNLKFDIGFVENWECNNYRVAYEGGNECVSV